MLITLLEIAELAVVNIARADEAAARVPLAERSAYPWEVSRG